MKEEREGNDFDVTMYIQREHKGRGGGCLFLIVCNQREDFLGIYRRALQNKKGGGGLK